MSRDSFYRLHASNLAWLVGGVSLERGDRMWEWVLENQIIPNLRPEMLAAIEDHKGQGHRTIIVSGSFAPLLGKLVAQIGAERAIATPLATKDGRYTGRIIPPLNIGTGKVERLQRFLNGEGRDIDPAASYLYTDSMVDAPVLEMIGHPVAVYPDAELASLAADRGWPMIGDTDLAVR